MRIVKESDMFLPIKTYLIDVLGCKAVYGEVANCDVLGLLGSANVIVEMKTTLSFKVIDQAIDRLYSGHYVYIAIPKRKEIPRIVRSVLKQYRIGLLMINEHNEVDCHLPAKHNRIPNRTYNIRSQIRSYHKSQIGGVKSGEGETDYSVAIRNIKEYLEREYRRGKNGGWVTIDQILEHCETHYSNPKPSIMATLQAKWNEDWCESKVENRRRLFKFKP